MTSYATRLASFTSWPHTCLSASAVASVGFHLEYDPSYPADLAVCSLCGLDSYNWNNDHGSSFNFHATRSPKCPFVCAAQQKKTKRNKKTRQQYKRKALQQTNVENIAEKSSDSSANSSTVNHTSLRSTIPHHATTSMHREVFIRLGKTFTHTFASHLVSLGQHVGVPPYIRQAEDMEAIGQG